MREKQKSRRRWRVAATLTAVMCAAAIAATSAEPAEAQPARGGGPPRPFTEQHLRESPVPSDSFREAIRLDSTRRATVVGRMRIIGERLGRLPLDIPEYHDEQPLADGAGGYGPMAYVFGSPYLHGFTHVNQFNAHGTYGAFVAVMWVDGEGTAFPRSYGALNLVPGVNCVYLAHAGANPISGWSAYIVAGNTTTGCPRPAAGAPALEVHARRHVGHTGQADYPAVARFDEDSTGQPLIGVRCLNAWCQIGPAGLRPRSPSHRGNAVLAGQREGRIHGWHDDQMLAVVDPSTGRLRPQVRATITPVPNLHTMSLADFTDRWVTVSTIWLQEDPAGTKYATKWGMRRGRNILELAFAAGRWHARVAPASAPTSYTRLIVEQHKHMDMVVPGTARFRWRLSDESVWVPCDQGCCRVDPNM